MAIIKYTASLSTKKNAALDKKNRQPHAHIMFFERIIENKQNVKPDYQFFKNYKAKNLEWGGYKKDERFTAKHGIGPANVLKMRQSLEKIINESYKKMVWIFASPANL